MNKVHAAIFALVLAGCQGSPEVVMNRPREVTVWFSALPRLNAGEGHYLLWATVPRAIIRLGEFNVSDDGYHLLGTDGAPARFSLPDSIDADVLGDAILSLQSDGVTQGTGSPILGGPFRGTGALTLAALDERHADAFGSDFSPAAGSFTVTAPTSPADSNSGVWFFTQESPPTPSLENLPPIPGTWRYEGWVIDKTDPGNWKYYSTGRFLRADSADFDAAGPGRGAGPAPDFPGQDFITGGSGQPILPNLNSGVYDVMVTLEPEPDNSAGPFFLQVLNSAQPSRSALAPGSSTTSLPGTCRP